MTVRARLLVLFIAVVALLILPLVYSARRLEDLGEIAFGLRTNNAAAFSALGELRASIIEVDRAIRSYVVTSDSSHRSAAHAGLTEARRRARDLIGAGFGDAAEPTTHLLDSLALATGRLEVLVGAGLLDEATQHLDHVRPLLTSADGSLTAIAAAIDSAGASELGRARAITVGSSRTALAAGIAAVALALALALWTTVALSRPLRRLRDATAAVAGGRFETPADLPYRRRDEMSFAGMTSQLAELDRLKAEFVNVVSHDLKAPLSLISGYSELIEEANESDHPDPQRQELLRAIREHARQLTERVNRLLKLSRFEAGAFPVQPEPVPVVPLFEGVRQAFSANAERKGITFTFELDSSLPAIASLDADCLYNEILGNLVSNALKFTPAGGAVAMRAWSDGEELHVTVSDSGPGIPSDELPHVFEKYYQVSRSSRSAGAGLGLAIVRQAVTAHGGRVEAGQSPEGGALFHVMLPLVAAVELTARPALT
jgi:signal transduction histidine kinase